MFLYQNFVIWSIFLRLQPGFRDREREKLAWWIFGPAGVLLGELWESHLIPALQQLKLLIGKVMLEI